MITKYLKNAFFKLIFKVLLATTKMYYAFFHNTPTMMIKRIIMVLAASFEFEKMHNADIVERQSDNEEVPAVNIL